MAIDANLILRGAQAGLAEARPVSNLLAGIQAGQDFQSNILNQQAARQQLEQQAALAPLQQQALEQQVAQQAAAALLEQQRAQQQLQSGALGIQQQQAALDALGVPDVPTAKELAFNAAKLSALPTTESKLAEIGRLKQQAVAAGRTTDNLDQLEQAFAVSEQAGNELLNAGVEAFERTGLITPEETESFKREQLELRERELTLKEQAEQRQATKLSAASEQALIKSQDASTQAGRNASEFEILANQVRDKNIVGGLAASTTETFKRLLGTQDDVTELRRRFNKVRLSEGLKNLPPGPATDRDVQEAFKGVPPENAPASQIESFLRGAAKMARFDQAFNEFRADFISQNNNTKGLLPAWKAHAENISDDLIGAQDQATDQQARTRIRFDAQGNVIQ